MGVLEVSGGENQVFFLEDLQQKLLLKNHWELLHKDQLGFQPDNVVFFFAKLRDVF